METSKSLTDDITIIRRFDPTSVTTDIGSWLCLTGGFAPVALIKYSDKASVEEFLNAHFIQSVLSKNPALVAAYILSVRLAEVEQITAWIKGGVLNGTLLTEESK